MKKGLGIILTALGTGLVWAMLSTKLQEQAAPAGNEDHYNGIVTGGVSDPIIDFQKEKPKVKRRLLQPAKKKFTPLIQTTQITINNGSSQSQTVHLWDLDRKYQEDSTISTLKRLNTIQLDKSEVQDMVYNPANGLIYTVNQNSDTVSILNQAGELVKTISLTTSLHPGIIAPVGIAINTKQSSVRYGTVYVACSVRNSVMVIGLNHEIIAQVIVGNRPMGIIFNPTNEVVYTSNYADNTVSAIRTARFNLVITLPVGLAPIGLGLDSETGDIYVANSRSNSVSVYDLSHNLEATLGGLGETPISMVYHVQSKKMLVIAGSLVYPVKKLVNNYQLENPVRMERPIVNAAYHSANQLLYGVNDKDLIALDSELQKLDSQELGANRIMLNSNSGNLWLAYNDTIQVFETTQAGVQINWEYPGLLQEFIYNPAKITHLRWAFSGKQRFNHLKVKQSSIAGKTISKSISLHQSPFDYLNVSDMTALNGQLIDGHSDWQFRIGPLQTITLIIKYQQHHRKNLIP